MNDDDVELKKKIQQDLIIDIFKKELSEQMKCDSESSYYICEKCNCWKMARVLHDVDKRDV